MPVNAFNGTHNWGYDGVLWYAVHELLRRAGGVPALRRRLPRRRARRDPGRRLQPPRPVGELPARVRAVPHGGAQHLGRPGQPRRRGVGRGAPLHPRQRADVARGLPRRRAAARRRARPLDDSSPVHLLEEMAIEVAALSAAPAPPADADRGVGPQRPGAGHAARGGRLRSRRAVERRLPPRRPRRPDRGDRGLLRRLRAALRAGQGVRARVLPRRDLLVVPRTGTTGVPVDTDRMPTWRLVVGSQNHDQIGNRAAGDRLTEPPRRRTSSAARPC